MGQMRPSAACAAACSTPPAGICLIILRVSAPPRSSNIPWQKTLAPIALKRQNHGVFSYKGFDHIALVTRNLTAMKTFYCDGLGLAMEQESKAKAGYNIVTLRAGDAVLDLFEAGPTNPAPSANLSEEHFCLCASGSSIYDVIATLKRKGLEPTQAEVNSGARGKGLSTFVRDPDGNKVEIKVD